MFSSCFYSHSKIKGVTWTVMYQQVAVTSWFNLYRDVLTHSFYLKLGSHAAYLFPSSLSPEILEGLLGSGSPCHPCHPTFDLLTMTYIYCFGFYIVGCMDFFSYAVGGVMAFLTLHEMLPLAFDYAGQKQAVKAVFLGMAFMSAR